MDSKEYDTSTELNDADFKKGTASDDASDSGGSDGEPAEGEQDLAVATSKLSVK